MTTISSLSEAGLYQNSITTYERVMLIERNQTLVHQEKGEDSFLLSVVRKTPIARYGLQLSLDTLARCEYLSTNLFKEWHEKREMDQSVPQDPLYEIVKSLKC